MFYYIIDREELYICFIMLTGLVLTLLLSLFQPAMVLADHGLDYVTRL
jgi:hypothetical protein